MPGTALAAAGLGAIEALTRGLAVELAPKRIRVNTIRAGSTDTPLIRSFLAHRPDPTGAAADARTAGESADAAIAAIGAALPLGRIGAAAEVAAAALFLMANPYVTGSIVAVDGGQTLA